jgi:HlyD family secretion protein
VGTVSYSEEKIVRVQAAGEVVELPAEVGDIVNEGDILAVLQKKSTLVSAESSALSLKDAQLSLTNMQKQLDNYNITSPIAGTVIARSYKAGDTLDSNRTVLAVVADMSSLTFTMDIDELDIRKIEAGQKVAVTADAVPDALFEGVVKTVGLIGVSSSGVTTYPVEVVIETYEGLRPGMNVSADIVAAQARHVLLAPAAAVSRGNVALVKEADAAREGMGERVERNNTPTGYVWVRVTTGLTDGNFIEIQSGLPEGVEVFYTPAVTGSGNQNMMFMPGVATPGGGAVSPGGGAGGNRGGGTVTVRPSGGGG